MNELQRKFHDSYREILGRNAYNQGLRQYVYTPYKGGYYSDCSSSICATMDRIGVGMPLLNTAGMYHSKLWRKVPIRIEGGHIHRDDVQLLRVGDALLFRGSDPSRPLQIGHVEAVYEISGTTERAITLCGHGSGTPSTKNMQEYLTARERAKAPNGKSRGLVCVIRAIQDSAPQGRYKLGWNQDETGWWYADTEQTYVKASWREIDGRWYVFDDAGYMVKGWFKDSRGWYYLNPVDGTMLSGQWVKVSGKDYYLTASGLMAQAAYIKDPGRDVYYLIDGNGEYVPDGDTETPDLNKWGLVQ